MQLEKMNFHVCVLGIVVGRQRGRTLDEALPIKSYLLPHHIASLCKAAERRMGARGKAKEGRSAQRRPVAELNTWKES